MAPRVLGAWWVCSCYLLQLHIKSQLNKGEQNLCATSLPGNIREQASKMWECVPGSAALLRNNIWTRSSIFYKRNQRVSLCLWLSIYLMWLSYPRREQPCEKCSATALGAEEARKPASHILLTSFPCTSAPSQPRAAVPGALWTCWAFSFMMEISRSVSWSRAAEVFCVFQC